VPGFFRQKGQIPQEVRFAQTMQAGILRVTGQNGAWMARPAKRGLMPIASNAGFPRFWCQARCVKKRVLWTWSQCSLPSNRESHRSGFGRNWWKQQRNAQNLQGFSPERTHLQALESLPGSSVIVPSVE
jgi:hypothetical protein